MRRVMASKLATPKITTTQHFLKTPAAVDASKCETQVLRVKNSNTTGKSQVPFKSETLKPNKATTTTAARPVSLKRHYIPSASSSSRIQEVKKVTTVAPVVTRFTMPIRKVAESQQTIAKKAIAAPPAVTARSRMTNYIDGLNENRNLFRSRKVAPILPAKTTQVHANTPKATSQSLQTELYAKPTTRQRSVEKKGDLKISFNFL